MLGVPTRRIDASVGAKPQASTADRVPAPAYNVKPPPVDPRLLPTIHPGLKAIATGVPPAPRGLLDTSCCLTACAPAAPSTPGTGPTVPPVSPAQAPPTGGSTVVTTPTQVTQSILPAQLLQPVTAPSAPDDDGGASGFAAGPAALVGAGAGHSAPAPAGPEGITPAGLWAMVNPHSTPDWAKLAAGLVVGWFLFGGRR